MEHIRQICSRARKKLGHLYRVFYKSSSSTATLVTLYKAFVRPILEYGCVVWDPHLVKGIIAVESVQRFATKLCLRNWSLPYQDRLQLLDLDSLFTRRKAAKLCYMYRMVHGLTAPSCPLVTYTHSYATRSHSLCLTPLYARTNSFLNSFYNSTIRLWNNLPSDVVFSSSVSDFKNLLHTQKLLPCYNF